MSDRPIRTRRVKPFKGTNKRGKMMRLKVVGCIALVVASVYTVMILIAYQAHLIFREVVLLIE